MTHVNSPDPITDFEYPGTVTLHSMSKSYPEGHRSILHKFALTGTETKYIGKKVVAKDLTFKNSYKLGNIFLSSDFVSGKIDCCSRQSSSYRGNKFNSGTWSGREMIYPTVNIVTKLLS